MNTPAEKVKTLNLLADRAQFLYYVTRDGDVCRRPRGQGGAEVLIHNAVTRDSAFLYFIDKDGDISRSPRAQHRSSRQPSLKLPRLRNKKILTIQRRFLGTAWAFLVCNDGTAYWANARTGTLLDSTRQLK